MATDPICGMKVDECGCCSTTPNKNFYQNKIFQLTVLITALYCAGYFIPQLNRLQMTLGMYLKTIAIPVTAGLFIGGVIDWLVPATYVSKLLASKRKSTIILAVCTGFLMSACCHGILAVAIQLYKKGASTPAVVAFLLASPWANLPMTILMFGFFGWKALLIIGSAVVIAIITGYIFQILDHYQLIESNPDTVAIESGFSIREDIRHRGVELQWNLKALILALQAIWSGTVALSNMVLGWILIGTIMASVAAAFIPADFMRGYMGASVTGLLVTLLLATVLEVCSEGTAPLAFEIYRQTGALGNAFVFLMAGVATDYTEIGLLWKNIGRRTAIWLPLITVPMIVLFGLIFNSVLIR